MTYDQFSDRSFRVLAEKIRNFGSEARELIKEASIDYGEVETLPESSFAWPERRLYPIHTPEHTALSQIYAHAESIPSYAREMLEKAAALYGVKIDAFEKVAEEVGHSPDDYLIPHRNFGLVNSPTLVKEACEFFQNNYKKMDLTTRANAAATLVKKAREFKQKIPLSIYKHAGLTQTNTKYLGEWLEVRSNMAQDPTVKSGYTKLAEFVQDKAQFTYANRQDMIKLADTISALDHKAGLTSRYDMTLPDPLMTVFNTTKLAAEASVKLGGKSVSLTKLLSIDPQHYGDVLGEDLVKEITDAKGQIKEAELIDILKTLPADLQLSLVKTLGL